MKHEILATRADAITLGEMRVRSTQGHACDTADYNGVFMDYVMEADAVRVVGFVAPTHISNSDLEEAFWVLADMVGADVVCHGNDEYHITWVKRLPPKPFPVYVAPKKNYLKEIGFILLVLGVLCLPFLAAGYNEAKFKQKMEVQQQWYKDHPKADILIFNCITDDMQVKCPNGAEKRFEVAQ